MKNPFKTFRDLQAKVKEHEEYIKAERTRTLKRFTDFSEKLKKEAFERWEKQNPPKFNHKDKVEVVVWESTKIATGKYPRPLYSGKIISIVRTDATYIPHLWCAMIVAIMYHEELKEKDHRYTCKAERIYCIDAGDMKYHEAKESDIMFKFNTK